MRARCVCSLAALALLLGCGQDGDPAPEPANSAQKPPKPRTIARCAERDADVTSAQPGPSSVQFLLAGGAVGSLKVRWARRNYADIAVERTPGEAERTRRELDEYLRRADAEAGEDRLFRRGSVVAFFMQQPSDSQTETLERCLR